MAGAPGFVPVEEKKRAARKALRELNQDIPLADLPTLSFDREQAFMVYASFSGDAFKTAAAMSVPETEVFQAEREGKWRDRLEAVVKLKSHGKPGDVERGFNRVNNFVQAHRMRCVLDRVVSRLYSLDTQGVIDFASTITVRKLRGVDDEIEEHKIGTRVFSDLLTAIEKCQMLTYMALGDTATERKVRNEQGDEVASRDIHAQIAEAVSKAAGDNVRQALAQQSQEQLDNIIENLHPPAEPTGFPKCSVTHLEAQGIIKPDQSK